MGLSSEHDRTSIHDLEKGAAQEPSAVTADDRDNISTTDENPDGDDESKEPTDLARVASIGISLHSVETEYGKRPSCFSSTLQEILFVLTTTLAVAQSSIVTGLTAVITARIGEDLNMTQAQVTWVTAASSLGAGCFLLFFGRVADLFGRRWLLLGSMAVFTCFLLIAGFANNPFYMDIIMGFTGLASSGSVPPAIGLLGSIYKKPSARKNKAFACFSAGNPLGFVVGMIISGVCYQIANWRTAFWTTAVIYGIVFVVAFFTVPKDDEGSHSPFNLETLKRFDYLGTLLAVAGIALFTSALSIAGDAPHGWRTGYVLAMLILGAFVIAGFVVWQGIFKYPLMPLHIWKDKNFSLLVIILALGFLGFSGNSFWLSLYFQEVHRLDALAIAARMLPMAIVGILVNVVAGLVMHKVSNKLLMTIGSLGFCGCFALLSAMPEHNLYWAFIFPALCLSVIGADIAFCVVNMYVMSSLPTSQQSIAGAILQTVTRIVTAVGLGVQTAAFMSLNPSGSGATSTEFRPYRGPFWVAMAASGLSLVFLPFLSIKRQGHHK